MAELVAFQGKHGPVYFAVSKPGAGTGSGVGAVSERIDASVHNVTSSLDKGLLVVDDIATALREVLAAASIDEAEVKLSLTVTGTGKFFIAEASVEGGLEISFKVTSGG